MPHCANIEERNYNTCKKHCETLRGCGLANISMSCVACTNKRSFTFTLSFIFFALKVPWSWWTALNSCCGPSRWIISCLHYRSSTLLWVCPTPLLFGVCITRTSCKDPHVWDVKKLQLMVCVCGGCLPPGRWQRGGRRVRLGRSDLHHRPQSDCRSVPVRRERQRLLCWWGNLNPNDQNSQNSQNSAPCDQQGALLSSGVCVCVRTHQWSSLCVVIKAD